MPSRQSVEIEGVETAEPDAPFDMPEMERRALDLLRGHPAPSTSEGLIRQHEVLSWRLDGYAAELRSVVEGYEMAKHRLTKLEERMAMVGVSWDNAPKHTMDDFEDFE